MKLKLIWAFFLASVTFAQNNYLDEYINIGIKNNLALQQKEFSLKKSIAALDEARGAFLPKISINARYSRAGGGRTIDFPVGDLINPIHSGLNSLMGRNVYPGNLENVSTRLMRKEEHDTKISLVQPLFNSDIYFNYKIKSTQVDLSSTEKLIYLRALIHDIKSAYFKYQQTVNYKKILENTYSLVTENLRVSNSLYKNDKVTEDYVLNSQTKLSEIEQSILDADKKIDLSKSYFNFLLNRDLQDDIVSDGNLSVFEVLSEKLDESIDTALKNREELRQLKQYQEMSFNLSKLNKAKYLPNLVFALDYGFQGEKYKFNEDSDYWRASLVFEWNLFNGLSDDAKIRQAEFDERILESKTLELEKRIIMQVRNIYQEVQVAAKSLETAGKRLQTAKKSFKIVEKKYAVGMISQVEYFAAQNNLLQAEINELQSNYNLCIKISDLEKLTASLNINQIEIE